MKERRLVATGMLVVMAIGACDSNPVTPAATSLVTASVQGVVTSEYTGDGRFWTLPEGLPRPFTFSLHSTGVGSSRNQGFDFVGNAKPEIGTYPLGELVDGVYAATFSYRDGDQETRFRATAGTLEVTESTRDRLVGSFRLEGVLSAVCTHTRTSSSRQIRCEPVEGGDAEITVAGRFDAVSRMGSSWRVSSFTASVGGSATGLKRWLSRVYEPTAYSRVASTPGPSQT